MPPQVARDERARASAEPRPRPGARPDVVERVHRGAVSGLPRERPPEEILVECERPRVRVSALEVDVRGLQIGRRQDDALADRRLEIRDVLRNAVLYAVRVPLTQGLGPRSVPCVELARS